MVGIDNPYSYSSSNQNTHRTLGSLWLNEGKPKEYPPAAFPLSNNSPTLSNQTYGNGQYISSLSSQYSTGHAWRAFRRDDGTTFSGTGFGAQNVYNTNTGLYTTGSNFTNVGGSNYFGEHIQIQLPQSIYLTSYKIHPSITDFTNRNLNTGVLVASSNGTSWTPIHSLSNVFWVDNTSQTFTISNATTPYNYYRLIATRVGNSNIGNFRDAFFVGEWWLYGNSNPQVPTLNRVGQVNLNSEIITTDKSLFNRPITLQLTSPTG